MPGDGGGQACLRIEGITKSFGGATVLSEVSFRVTQGAIKGLIGPNGAGKTTLFNVITGLYAPEKGEVVLDGKKLTGERPDRIARGGVGRTFQKPSLAWGLTVFENVLLAAMNNRRNGGGGGRSHRREWVEHCLAACGIDPSLWHREAARVGLGTVKKVEFARAASLSPRLILLDEICSGLSETETDELLALIGEYEARERCSILFVEHDLRAVRNICRQVVVLDFGAVIFDGPIRDAFDDARVIEAYIGGRDA